MAQSSTDDTTQRPIVAQSSAASGKPDSTLDIASTSPDSGEQPEEIDLRYYLTCMDDAERAEREWRTRGREIVQIYRNQKSTQQKTKGKKWSGRQTFNILYSNTEVMLPSIYSKPPQPVVRSRFTAPSMKPPAAGRPAQKDIDTAASIMEKALEVVVDDEQSDEAIKSAIKDMLLPGRGICRVRWKPEMKTVDIEPDPLTGNQIMDPETGMPQQVERKVWEEVGDEYVYWEDILIDPVRQSADTDWIAFRHLFAEQRLVAEFQGSPEFDKVVAAGKVKDLLKWTEESAAKDTVGGGSPMKASSNLGDHVQKAMVWELWDRINKRILWIIRDGGGLLLRVDDDSYQLEGFFPIPAPILAISTTDSRIPVPFYDQYNELADDLDESSKRISAVTRQVKVRGGYNSASPEIANILTADDQKMIPVDGVDMMNGGLQNHIWLVPILEWVNALKELYAARDQQKQAIYEVMGISDIMRGATKASETATAQRIKGSMGMVRLSDQKLAAANFSRDLLRLKGDIIAKNFDAETLALMTGEEVTPQVMAILRSDFMRTCTIDIESDSTVVADEQQEIESNAQLMMALQQLMAGAQGMLQTGLLPPPQVILMTLELIKMIIKPIRNSRGVTELIDDFMEQLQAQIAMQQSQPPVPPPGMPPGAPPPEGAPPEAGPPGPPNGAAAPPVASPPGGGSSPPPGGMPPMPPLQ
jgi:hypothetical protein